MPLGIDISPYNLIIKHDGTTSPSARHYGIVGVTPTWQEPIVWTNPATIRKTSGQKYLSLSELWRVFNQDYKTLVGVSSVIEDDPINMMASKLIVEGLRANISNYSSEFCILAIDNTLSELHQSTILRQFSAAGFGRRELLWRPVAIALTHLIAPHTYDDGDSLLIIDTDSFQPEITFLELKEYRQHLVPLRKFPENRRVPCGEKWCEYSSANMLEQYFKNYSGNNTNLFKQLTIGPFSGEVLRFLDSGSQESEFWVRDRLNHSRLSLDKTMREDLARTEVLGKGFRQLISSFEQIIHQIEPSTVLWHGLPARLNLTALNTQHVLMESDAIAIGSAEYGRRLLTGEPTYLDTLPGLEILSLEKKTGSHKFFTVIPRGEVEGGKKVKIPEKLTKFKLEEGTEEFTAILKNPTTNTYKRLVTKLPPIEYNGENIPLVLDAETQPAQGHAKVTIEGVGGQLDLFGPKRVLELDWESGKDVTIEDIIVYKYNGPEVYPVRGRIADDPECRKAAKYFVKECKYMGSKVPFRDGQVSYVRIHEPWGWKDPFNKPLREPTRALFGALDENDPEIDDIAEMLANKIYEIVTDESDRFKYLNYMFRYAPERFRDELRDIYKQSNPSLNWNSIYAVGRTFYRKEDYELFVDFMLKHSQERGYPEYPTEAYTKIYFWAYFRPLCYYEDTIGLPIDKAERVLESIYQYTVVRSKSNWSRRPFEKGRRNIENLIKYILSVILFSIRFRKKKHNFLAKETILYNKMVEVVSEMTPQIDYPKTMFKTRQIDKLNDFVLRFLKDEQTERDLGVLKGLVVE